MPDSLNNSSIFLHISNMSIFMSIQLKYPPYSWVCLRCLNFKLIYFINYQLSLLQILFIDWFYYQGKMKRTLLIIMVCGISCWIWLGLICLEAIPFNIGSLYCATILASGITYSSGPIFFEFTVELVYPVPEGVVGGFLTVVYNTTGMIFLFLFNIPALRK